MFPSDCAICDRLEERFFRKYGLKLNREASWATSRDGIILVALMPHLWFLGRQMPDWEGARHAAVCGDDNSPPATP